MFAAIEALPRFALLEPTPIERLARLEAALGPVGSVPRLYAKRDDVAGIGGGGNKLRKLELLLGEALAQGCDTFVTTGARQSNHARLSAAAAARAGMACELVLTDTVARDDAAYRQNGNVLLDALFGARVHRLPAGADALAAALARAEALAGAGRRAYVVGAGGSSPLGALGYARCAAEIRAQEAALGERFAAVVVPNGSAGTHAGLAAGMALARDDAARVLSFAVLAPLERAEADTLALANAALERAGAEPTLTARDIRVDGSQRGPDYGVPTEAMREAVQLLARTEGMLADPVYSGKALAGLIAGVRAGRWPRDAALLFILTGGTPGLFAYEPEFRAGD